ncbi:MAG: rod shape-determining protein MreD [Thermomicrobiales bacterium]
MARILFGLLLFSAAMIQAVTLPSLHVLGVLPDLVLIILLVWSTLRGTAEGLIWAFAAGILLDLLALDPLGTNGLALLAVVLMAGPARRRLLHSGIVFPMLLVILATMVHAFVLLALRSDTNAGLPVSAVFRLAFLQALLNAVLVPPMYVIASGMNRWVGEDV